ncbi:DUF234 domain-containing protein [Campylobacter hepaticus]|uniref:ATP-binding protein n=1 Tax=Campylobacter hepaticus TaxID=1813019 RepID=A0A6A7JR37_9BACT|nr:DUF234 domain-containing protein [Campylobacter hepaticus]AXP08653.1 ATP-binding protein [Campylobacter hepaticus]MCZ0772496.1 DUF234 domain-containing protein [Campylobacter hepaticus]MCZ0773964.1 DUF234 domain-containing protein [Campylobacter hepaticus]MCZ0775216.1 DUF234 domain-containing protein [Campylobacter hepaticus]MDX2323283.1 ATP-binding protein [Campylobacter hepaticus]
MHLAQIFDFYSVFDGFDQLKELNLEKDIFENIQEKLLKNYLFVKNQFDFDDIISYALILLAKNNRKRFSINKKIQHFKALSALQFLLKQNILKLEVSKETKPNKDKKQKIKKELRSYVIQDKLMFTNHFTRFFFYFLKPNEKLILQGKYEEVLKKIKDKFKLYQSFCFEQLCREFVEYFFKIDGVQSYWNKDMEVDLYYQDEKLCLVGEVKFKNKKICKNIFNLLKLKVRNLKIIPDYYIIISKNGFSQEMYKICKSGVFLFELNDFRGMINE